MNNKIAFYLYAASDGGQFKVLLNLASSLANKGYEVVFIHSIITSDIFIKDQHFNLKFIQLKAKSRIKSAMMLNQALKEERPDILISGGSDNNCVAVASKLIPQLTHKVIITEHTDLTSILKHSSNPLKRVLPYLMRVFYPKSDIIAAVSRGVAEDLSKHLGLNINDIKVLYNPVVNDNLIELSNQNIDHPWFFQKDTPVIVSVGRLSTQKDYFNLINAFYLFSKKQKANLLILGEGPDRPKLQELINSLGMEDNIDLFGRVNNPYAYMRNSDLFVLSSKWEGLPTVLIEALACGVPIVSTDCPHGPREILENGKWGKLVPIEDSKALAKAMLDTIKQPKQDTSERAKDFTYEKSLAKYIEVIESLIHKK